MRHSAWSTRRVFSGLLGALALSGAAAGCAFEPGNFCTDQPDNCGAGGKASTSTSMASQMTTSSMGMTTSDSSSSTGVAQECDPLKLAPGAALEPTCGIFVEPGKTGDGKQGTPFGTLAEALTSNPMNLPIYVCATAATGLTEAIVLGAAEKVIGGVTCGDWKAAATKTPWTAATNAVPLTLDHTTGALVQGFAITAANAMGFDGATLQGNSSIGVVADGATATLESVDVVAGTGAAGGDGMDQAGRAPGRTDFAALFDGNAGAGCNVANGGGLAKDYSTCPAGGGTTEGGAGGNGGNLTGAAGSPGGPNLGAGAGGAADPGGAWDCMANGGFGKGGNPGGAGSPGAGGSEVGTVTSNGYAGAAGGPGGVGGIAQGGGGGSGRAKAADACTMTGSSGGGGGAGACGGLGGGGGGAGGASLALLSRDSTLTLAKIQLTAVQGGDGGAGGDGQLGGIGGNGANGGGSACDGGKGGNGGNGAGGGGGKGGPSIGLASVGTAPDISDAAITVSMSAAAGDAPGGGNVPGSVGGMGDTSKKQGF